VTNPIGPLGPADEAFNHQVTDTFATVGVSDPSWTEKVCAMAARRDGTLQLGFGLGKYTNRNVLDGYGGMSRGREQITVRGSRRLFPEPDLTAVGPIRYEVLEPMKRVRFALAANDTQPLAFDWVFEAAVPPATEERIHQRVPLGYRVSAELVRYHQIGIASGWVELDGERHEIDPDNGCRPATTRGACATTWAHRPPTSTPSTPSATWTSGSSGARSSCRTPTGRGGACSSTSSTSRGSVTASTPSPAPSSTPTAASSASPRSPPAGGADHPPHFLGTEMWRWRAFPSPKRRRPGRKAVDQRRRRAAMTGAAMAR
jgi:hypothetical protein